MSCSVSPAENALDISKLRLLATAQMACRGQHCLSLWLPDQPMDLKTGIQVPASSLAIGQGFIIIL